jgi:hypothetical protein
LSGQALEFLELAHLVKLEPADALKLTHCSGSNLACCSGQGWTCEPAPRSRRTDSRMANVVLAV